MLDTGDLEFYVSHSKTDQLGAGFCFHVSGKKFKGFSIPDVMKWYLDSTGLTGTDYLFPRFSNCKGLVVAQGGSFISCSLVATQLKE